VTVRAFIVLLIATVIAIWIGDGYAVAFTSPGIERSFAVLVIAAAIVAPVAWLLSRIGWIKGRFELGRKKEHGARNGSDA
jgi:hypothetical protein